MTRTAQYVLCILLLMSWLPALGGAEVVGSVEVKQTDVRRFEMLAVDLEETIPQGVVKTLTPPKGKSFLVIWMALKVKVGKDEFGDDYVSIDEDHIRLVDGDGKSYAPVGTCTRDGRFQRDAGSFYLYETPDRALYPHSLVFAPASDQVAFTLTFGNSETPLMAPVEAEPAPEPAAIADFIVRDVEVVEKLEETLQLGPFDAPEGEFIQRVTAAGSRFVQIHLIAKPKAANSEYQFRFATTDIGISYGENTYVAPAGYFEGGDFYTDDNWYYSDPDALDEFPAVGAKLVFALPDGVMQFDVLYLTRPVAKGELTK